MVLTGENSSTMRSPAVASSPLHSSHPRTSTGRLSWLGGSLEQARRRSWWMAKVWGIGTLAIFGYVTLRRGWLLHPSDLGKLHDASEGSRWCRWAWPCALPCGGARSTTVLSLFWLEGGVRWVSIMPLARSKVSRPKGLILGSSMAPIPTKTISISSKGNP